MCNGISRIALVGFLVVFIGACAEIQPTIKMQKMPVATGELRLLDMKVPESVGEDLPYEIQVDFEASGQPQIRKACFRWLSEKASVSSPDLYCYAWEAQTDKSMGSSACSRWVAEGPYAQSSPLFCAQVENIQYGNPGRFTVKLRTQNVEQIYNKLECHVEYLRGGEPEITNKISSRIRVEKLGQ